MSYIKNQEASIYFALVEPDGQTAVTTPAPTVLLSLDEAALTPASNSPTHLSSGLWYNVLSAAELNADDVGVLIYHPSAITLFFSIHTVEEQVTTTGLISSLQSSGVNVTQINSVTLQGDGDTTPWGPV